jgi:hypothetical protein
VDPTKVGMKNTFGDILAFSDEKYDSKGNKDNSGNQKYLQVVLGDGHIKILYAYVHKTFLKHIKILLPAH